MENNRPSMRDIARQLNVSHATVSMALRNNPRISKARRDQVHRIAKEIGYRPDPMLSSLVSYRQGKQSKPMVSTLAWINRWKDPKQLRGFKEFDSYWRGAVDAAEGLGYKVEEFVVNDDLKGRRLNDILFARGIQGILVPPHASDDSWSDLGLEWDKFSVVRFGFGIGDLRADMIGNDQMRSAELAMAKSYAIGYRAIGFLTNQLFDTKTDGNFRMGVLRGFEIHPEMKPVEPLMLKAPIWDKSCESNVLETLKDWIEANALDAIFSSDIGLAKALENLGYKVPDDIAVASTSVGEIPGSNAGLDQNPFQIGRVAVQVLVGKINRNDKGEPKFCRRVLVEGRWIDGSSLPEVVLDAG